MNTIIHVRTGYSGITSIFVYYDNGAWRHIDRTDITEASYRRILAVVNSHLKEVITLDGYDAVVVAEWDRNPLAKLAK